MYPIDFIVPSRKKGQKVDTKIVRWKVYVSINFCNLTSVKDLLDIMSPLPNFFTKKIETGVKVTDI